MATKIVTINCVEFSDRGLAGVVFFVVGKR